MDSNYLTMYQQGISYYDTHAADIASNLCEGRCVVVCSLPKVGNKSLLAYLTYKLPSYGEFETYFDEFGTYDLEKLEQISLIESTRKKIVILPYFEDASKEFIEGFHRMLRYRQNSFLTVLRLHSDFLENPTRFFPVSTEPYESVVILRPFVKETHLEIIRVREKLVQVTLPERARAIILRYCGGHVALIKRAVTLFKINKRLSLEDLLIDPASKSILIQLEFASRTLRQETLSQLGMYDDRGGYAIPLLGEFISRLNEKSMQELSPLHRQLLALLLSNKGVPVSMQEIQRVLEPGKPFSLWKMYKLMQRFGDSVKDKYQLRTEKGKGYYLVENLS